MLEGSCDCGAVHYTVDAALEEVTDCNCGICRRYGTLWSYYSPRVVTINGETNIYLRGERKLEFHRCKTCGCVMAWRALDRSRDRMGINARMLPLGSLDNVRVKKLDGASWVA
jgi:hypothetical protein